MGSIELSGKEQVLIVYTVQYVLYVQITLVQVFSFAFCSFEQISYSATCVTPMNVVLLEFPFVCMCLGFSGTV